MSLSEDHRLHAVLAFVIYLRRVLYQIDERLCYILELSFVLGLLLAPIIAFSFLILLFFFVGCRLLPLSQEHKLLDFLLDVFLEKYAWDIVLIQVAQHVEGRLLQRWKTGADEDIEACLADVLVEVWSTSHQCLGKAGEHGVLLVHDGVLLAVFGA